MQASFYAPQIPGVTSESGWSRANAPALSTALAEPEEEKRARKLEDVAKDWFEQSKWYYREAAQTTAFYFGWQYGYYSETEGRYIANPVQRANHHVRIVVNTVKPTVDQATGILTRDDPIFGAASAKLDVADEGASEAADDLTRDFWRQHRLRDMYRMSARDAFVCGSQPILVEWDETAGSLVKAQRFDQETGGMVPAFTLTSDPADPRMVPQYKKQGDLKFSYLTLDQVGPDPSARRDDDGEAIFVRERWSYARLKETYPDHYEKVVASREEKDEDQRKNERADRSSPQGTPSDQTKPTEDLDVYRCYVRSCRDYPRGLEVRFACGVILYTGDNPVYPMEQELDESWPRSPWPIFTIRCDQRKTSFWGAGKVVQMIDPQRAFNGTFSKAVQHVAAVANTKVLLPKGLDSSFSDEIGQVLRYSRMVDPSGIKYLAPPDIPQAYAQLLQMLKGELEYIAGINEASMGETPSANSSGRQVSLLQSANIGKLKPMKDSMDETWAEAIRHGLFLFRRHADQKRKILILGHGREAQIRYLDRADIAAGTDISVFSDKSLPSDPTAKILALQNVTQMLAGVEDPKWKKALLKLLRLHDFNGYLEELDIDEVKADRLVRSIDQGKPWFRHESDDPISMVIALEGFVKSGAFEERVQMETEQQGWSPLLETTNQAWTYFKTLASTPNTPPEPSGFVPPATAPAPPMGMAPPAPAMPGAPPMPMTPPPEPATAPDESMFSGLGPFAPATAPIGQAA